MQHSTDTLSLLSLLETRAFSKRLKKIRWDSVLKSVQELGRISWKKDTDPSKIALLVNQLYNAMTPELFTELIGVDEKPLAIKQTLPSGKTFTKRFSGDWAELCTSPVSLDESDYPPGSWPLWFNGTSTVFFEYDTGRIAIENKEDK
jgi:hypothetical protein